ncbi:anaphase-promoting complex subunit 11 RING-H2 finger-domain-containing protein [Suillus ampliporus]|nr:anaphase-promoting complex subunit 11 RING-H2 finger-domain-containing protein [Suillus ampliporus]
MNALVKYFSAVSQSLSKKDKTNHDQDEEGDICGICRIPFEGCCPWCKIPGNDCPLIWGKCSHVFHMHCLLKWLGMAESKQRCPLDRGAWVTAERKANELSSK